MGSIISNIKNFHSNLMRRIRFMNIMKIKLGYLFFFVFLAALAACFEGISVGLLVPLIKGIIEMDFGFAREAPIIKNIIAAFPQLFTKPNSPVFILLLGFIFCTAVVKNTLFYISAVGIAYQVRYFASSMRKGILTRYMTFGKLYFDKTSQGYHHSLIAVFTKDMSERLKCIGELTKYILLLIVYFAIMIKISWKLTAFILLIPPIFYFSVGWLIRKTERTSKDYAVSRTQVSKGMYDILTCLPLIKSYNAEEKERSKFGYKSDYSAQFEFSLDKKYEFSYPFQETIAITLSLLLISVMAFLYIKEQSVELAGFLVYFYLLKRVATFMGMINLFRTKIASMVGAREEIMKVFDDKDKYFVSEGKRVFPGLQNGIEINHLTFSYIPGHYVLKDISFYIEKGKMTAIIGPTGAGKTTIINLLLRFYDCPPSSIKINGVDIRDFTLKSLRSHMAFVSQEPLLFNETLKKNISYGKDIISKEELIDIAKKARLYDYIVNLPKGFDTYVGDRGVKLSGGEKQRVAIARALLKGTEILLLDEATSSLDTKTEKLIQGAIEEAIKGRTTIVIAHRLSTIRNADKIVVIENGRLIEQGSLNELLERKGKFYEYWEEQKFF